MNPSTLLALVALVAAVAALAFYLGRITAPQPKTKPRPQAFIHMLAGSTGGKHRAPDFDDTAVVPRVGGNPPNLLKPPDRRPEPEWPSDEHAD